MVLREPSPVWKTSASGAPDKSSLSHFSAMTRPSWLGRAVRNRHRHAIEQAARRWRGGRREDSARTCRKILISTQVGCTPGTPTSPRPRRDVTPMRPRRSRRRSLRVIRGRPIRLHTLLVRTAAPAFLRLVLLRVDVGVGVCDTRTLSFSSINCFFTKIKRTVFCSGARDVLCCQ